MLEVLNLGACGECPRFAKVTKHVLSQVFSPPPRYAPRLLPNTDTGMPAQSLLPTQCMEPYPLKDV